MCEQPPGLMGDPLGVMDGESRDVTRRRRVLSRYVDAFAASSRPCALEVHDHAERLHVVTARVATPGRSRRRCANSPSDSWEIPLGVVDGESRDMTRKPEVLSRCLDAFAASSRVRAPCIASSERGARSGQTSLRRYSRSAMIVRAKPETPKLAGK